MASKTKRKGTIEKVVESATDAAEELGTAAHAFRESWDHVQAARRKGRPATRAVGKAAKAVTRTGKKAVRTVTGAAKRTVKKRR